MIVIIDYGCGNLLSLKRALDEFKFKSEVSKDKSKILNADLLILPGVGAFENAIKLLKKNDLIIYESTVYPGVTEEICVPILEKASNLKFNEDFTVGYSPERINPGDKKNNIKNVIKIIAIDKTVLFLKKLNFFLF